MALMRFDVKSFKFESKVDDKLSPKVVEKRVDEFRLKTKKEREEFKKLKIEINFETKTYEKLKKQIEEKSIELGSKEEEFKKISNKKTKKAKHLKAVEDSTLAKKTELKELTAQIEKDSSALNELKNKIEHEQNKLDERIAKNKAEMEKYNVELTELQSVIKLENETKAAKQALELKALIDKETAKKVSIQRKKNRIKRSVKKSELIQVSKPTKSVIIPNKKANKKDLLIKKYKLLLALQAAKNDNQITYFKPYDWQLKFWEQTKSKKQLMIKAAVRVGKTDTTVIPLACWLTNTYPDYWNGYIFNYPITCYVLGQSYDQLKRVLQKKLLGEIDHNTGRFTGGWIPSRFISSNPKHIDWNGAVKGGIKSIRIKTTETKATGMYSTLYFFSYEQGQGVLMGDSVDVVLIDEQVKDPSIYPQLVNRTSTGAKLTGGLILASMTPEYGRTPLIKQFQEDLKPHQYLMSVTWWDAPHWTKKMIEENLESLPAHLRDLKSKGVEIMGSGLVYPFSEESLKERLVDPPSYFRYLGAIDFGIRTGALVVGVLNPDNKKITIIEAIRTDDWGINRIADKMLSYGTNLKWAWPMDGYQIKENSGSGITQLEQLRRMGVKTLGVHAHLTIKGEDGTQKKTTSVEAGVQEVYHLLSANKLTIDPTLSAFWEEFRFYAREEGVIKHKKNHQNIKVGDHIMDAFRYLVISMKYATPLNYEQAKIKPIYLSGRENPYNLNT